MNDFLSDYSIKETIGKGTFSIVKLGINKKTKEKVAIKILKKKKIIHKEDVERIEREINILKKLNHINVIKIYKINEDDEKYYIVMEFCENGELFHYIVERQRLNEDEASFFFYQLINGLEYIHSENIVHRDLKPENLLLGKDNILKIIDFGLSNFCEPENFLETPCGSPCYASPEMVCGNKYNGHLIDIWSTGIIVFAMVCGYLPFEDPDNDILFKKILKCKIKYPEYLSNMTINLMKKILVVDPLKRITLEEIKQHPFYLKGKAIFAKKHHNLVKEVEKTYHTSNTLIKKIKSLKFITSDDCINNMVTSGGLKDGSNEEILNISTKNYNIEDNDEYCISKHYRKNSEDSHSQKHNKIIKKENKDKKEDSRKKNSKTPINLIANHNQLNKNDEKIKEIKEINSNNIHENKSQKKEKKNSKDENENKNKDLIQININNENINSNNNIKHKTFYFNKLIIGHLKNKEKDSRPSSTENKNIHECETGVINLNLNNDTKNNYSLLQKLLNNNNFEQGKYYNTKIILSKNNKNNILNEINQKLSNKDKQENNSNQQIDNDMQLFFNTVYKTNKKINKTEDISMICQSFKSHTISNKPRQRRNCKLTPINLKINKNNNNKNSKNKKKKEEIKNNSCCNHMKKTFVKNIKKLANANNNKCNSIKNNNNLIKKYIVNFDSSNNNNIINKNFLSSNNNNNITNNITNNISIIKSPIKTSRKEEISFSKQYTMKLDLGRLKSNDNNQDYSTSINIINNFNMNINQLKQMQLNSTTNNNNINFGTSLSNNLNNTNNKILLSNNELSPNNNTNMNNTNRNNNFFNHKKLLISTLNKKINSPEGSKISNYISISSGEFFKIKKTVIQKRHKKNEMNFQKNNFSNISSNISSIIYNNNKQKNNSTKNKGKSANKDKRIPLIGLNYKKIKPVKKSDIRKDLLTLKRKQKDQKYSSVDKEIMKKDSKQLFSNRLNYKKMNSSKFKNSISSIIKIKKVNGHNNNKSSSGNIIARRINSGNKTTVNHNNHKFFNKNIINNGSNILINSYIKYSNLHNKMTNKK